MKIAIVCHARFGGSGVIATELGLSLAQRGHDVHFVAEQAPPRLSASDDVTLHEVKVPTHPLFPNGEYALALASTLSRLEVDLIHVHYAIPLAVSAVLSRELSSKPPRLITTVHGTDVLTLGREASLQPVVRHALSKSDLVTAPSKFLAKETELHFGLRNVEVVGNFVDTVHFQPGEPNHARKVLTHNSNFRSLKRVADVVRIFKRVRAQTACSLQLIGDGPERYAIEAMVTNEGLRGDVRFFGEVREIVPLLQRSTVFLMPSEIESFGLAALEAMSCGVPVVASRVGGVPEVVVDGESGFLHAVGDVESMSASTLKLLEDSALHRRMSEAARTACVERWQVGPITDAWEGTYARVLGTT